MNKPKSAGAILTLLVIAAFLLPANLLAGNAKMTIYTKGASSRIFQLDSVKNVAFTSANSVKKESGLKIPVTALRTMPSRQSIALFCTGTPGSTGSLEVYAINGRIASSLKFQLSGSGEKRIDLPGLGQGMYVARYINGTKTITKNILRQY